MAPEEANVKSQGLIAGLWMLPVYNGGIQSRNVTSQEKAVLEPIMAKVVKFMSSALSDSSQQELKCLFYITNQNGNQCSN